jgi:putative transcriptional regulator
VERTQVFALGLGRVAVDEPWWTRVTAEVGVLHLHRDPADLDGVEDVRLFAGYAGWSAEQLEAEVAEEAWFVVDALPRDVFTMHPERLWQDVLRRQRGSLAMFALFPPDPSLN